MKTDDNGCTSLDSLSKNVAKNNTVLSAAFSSDNGTSDDSDVFDKQEYLANRLKHWVFDYNIPSNAT